MNKATPPSTIYIMAIGARYGPLSVPAKRSGPLGAMNWWLGQVTSN